MNTQELFAKISELFETAKLSFIDSLISKADKIILRKVILN